MWVKYSLFLLGDKLFVILSIFVFLSYHRIGEEYDDTKNKENAVIMRIMYDFTIGLL